ncbi:nuclear transport factor 2 family protein [Microbacterium sp. RD1]|uniref:nuclear transport factor 2 family protein n=1 Tax=Microbacterium sp. RD1 TaxID=3457313 RepID=UPI003FA5C413
MSAADETDIRSVIDSWAVWRDAGDWERLRTTWHPGGRMHTTWFRGTADEFVDGAAAAFAAGVLVHHFLGGTAVDVSGSRAIAQTKMTISQRLVLDDVEVDVTCTGRFYDFFEQREGRWALALRQPIYEKDRIDPVTPGRYPRLDEEELATYPPGCRHLLYSQTRSGMTVHREVPGLVGAEVERLYEAGDAWLAGDALGSA